jgi:hypothetical protein
VNREQIDVKIDLRGCLMNGVDKETGMVLAGNRILRSLCRAVMLVTRGNGRRVCVGRRPSLADQACRHTAERGQHQQY